MTVNCIYKTVNSTYKTVNCKFKTAKCIDKFQLQNSEDIVRQIVMKLEQVQMTPHTAKIRQSGHNKTVKA